MKEFENIRKYYKPIQPSVRREGSSIRYQEINPAKDLSPFVYCFWQLNTLEALEQPFVYRVVSDGCIDIFFNHSLTSENFVMGFCRKYTEFPIGTSFKYIGIRFLQSAFPLLFGIHAKALSNRSQELHGVLPRLSNWISTEIQPTLSFETIVQLLNKKLTALVLKQPLHFDVRFFKALHLIIQKHGFLDMEKELDTGLSPRQLRRIFNYYIGTTAKTFSNVVRFQYILNADPTRQQLKNDKMYFDVGFFDQAHFIKNFKTFYGVTPSEAFY